MGQRRTANVFRVYDAVRTNAHITDAKSFALQLSRGLQDGRMLDLRRNQMRARTCVAHHSKEGCVVGLSTSAAKNDFFRRSSAKQTGHADRADSSSRRAACPRWWILEALPKTSRDTRTHVSSEAVETGVVALKSR